MAQTYVHLSGRDQDNAILKGYGLQPKEEKLIESQRPSLCQRCREPNDPKARFCWKCGMILDKSLTVGKLKEEAKRIEDTIMRSEVVDVPTKKIIKSFPTEFKDLILETVLKQIVENRNLRQDSRENYQGGRTNLTGLSQIKASFDHVLLNYHR